MVTVEAVRISDHAESARALFAANWDETGFDFPLDLDVGRYQALQDAGVLFALAAFEDGEIIGYSTAAVTPHAFNPAITFCASDALFVRRDKRCGSAAARLIKATEREASRRGARRMLWHTRAGTPLAETFRRRGYLPADVVVMKELDHGC